MRPTSFSIEKNNYISIQYYYFPAKDSQLRNFGYTGILNINQSHKHFPTS